MRRRRISPHNIEAESISKAIFEGFNILFKEFSFEKDSYLYFDCLSDVKMV